MSKWPLAQARESGVSPALLTVPVHAHMHALVCVCIPFYSGNITSVQAGAVLMPLAMFLLSLKSIRVLY